MAQQGRSVVGGVDTHGETHHAAVIDEVGRQLGDRQFLATAAGYRRLLAWLRRHGQLMRVGVEGTGCYGAELTRVLRAAGVEVVEVDRPDRKTRRAKGKSDPVDAYAAAAAALSGRAAGTPKARDGRVEAIRTLRVERGGAVKARTQAVNQMRSLLVTAPAALRERLAGLDDKTKAPTSLIDACARLRSGGSGDAEAAVKQVLRRLARRARLLSEEIAELDAELAPLVAAAAPQLLAVPGVGVQVAAQLLVTAGDNPERLRSEAAFAHLCGVAPIPASSGKTRRHRLNRGGDRAANSALYIVVITRLRHDPRSRAYAARRAAEGLTTKEIIRCLKRYVAREIYRLLVPRPPKPTDEQAPAA
jgi:transposase